jgi:hypothetical protein
VIVYLGQFIKITDVAQMIMLLLYAIKICIHFDKNGLCYILGDFFTNSSGHPVCIFERKELDIEAA